MSENGSYDGDELAFDLDEEVSSPIAASFPLPPELASVLMAWAIDHTSESVRESQVPEDSRTVLVVDDDRASRVALMKIFLEQGWEVAEAATLGEALAALDSLPHCLVLDLMLPDGDGAEVLQQVRSRGLSTRVVVATGVADPTRLEAVFDLGPDRVLLKPIDLASICRACNS